jgi:hypothetical protein
MLAFNSNFMSLAAVEELWNTAQDALKALQVAIPRDRSNSEARHLEQARRVELQLFTAVTTVGAKLVLSAHLEDGLLDQIYDFPSRAH